MTTTTGGPEIEAAQEFGRKAGEAAPLNRLEGVLYLEVRKAALDEGFGLSAAIVAGATAGMVLRKRQEGETGE